MNGEMDFMILNGKLKGMQGTVDNIDEKVALESSMQELKTLVENSGGRNALESTSQTILQMVQQSTSSQFRPDDFIRTGVVQTDTLVTTQKTCSYDNATLLGSVTIPNECFKIKIEYSIKQSSGSNSVQIVQSPDSKVDRTGTNADTFLGYEGTTSYATYTKEITGISAGQIIYFLLYVGSSVTGYCNSFKVHYYGYDRVVTEEVFEVGTIKSYGTANSRLELPYPHRLDRTIFVGGTNLSGCTFKVMDGITYLHYVGSGLSYIMLY